MNERIKEPTLLGHWHHGNGVLCCGTLRIASANFDTNPTKEIQNAVFQDICDTMNLRTERYEQYIDDRKLNDERTNSRTC